MAKYNYFAKGMDNLLFNDTGNLISDNEDDIHNMIEFESKKVKESYKEIKAQSINNYKN